jgi:hypothetical protein
MNSIGCTARSRPAASSNLGAENAARHHGAQPLAATGTLTAAFREVTSQTRCPAMRVRWPGHSTLQKEAIAESLRLWGHWRTPWV